MWTGGSLRSTYVMPANAGIHVFARSASKPWMAGTRPAMTNGKPYSILPLGKP
jgi:hypothetical protein